MLCGSYFIHGFHDRTVHFRPRSSRSVKCLYFGRSGEFSISLKAADPRRLLQCLYCPGRMDLLLPCPCNMSNRDVSGQALLWKSGIGNATYVQNGREPAAERYDGSDAEKMTVHFDFDNSYARLGSAFHRPTVPSPVAAPYLLKVNRRLAEDVDFQQVFPTFSFGLVPPKQPQLFTGKKHFELKVDHDETTNWINLT